MGKSKKIAVNARFLLPGKLEGIGTYSNEILQRLVCIMPDYEFHFAFDRAYDKQFVYAENVKAHVVGFPARHPFLWYLWFEFSINKWVKTNKFDAFFSPDSFLSLRNNTPTLLTMHDIAFEHFSKHNPKLVQAYYKRFFPKYAEKASHILCVSEFTKKDILKHYKINPDKISSSHCGVSDSYFVLDEDQRAKTRAGYNTELPYFISVGSINPRKNLGAVIQAFNAYKIKSKSKKKLIIVGAKGWKAAPFYKELEASEFKEDIVLTGHLNPSELNKAINAAQALIFPSLYEGFGIPIIESFAAGTPVITSNVSSMPEVAGDAALIVNPTKIDEIVGAMAKLDDETYRSNMIEAGLERVKEFSWDAAAEQVKEHLLRLTN